MNLFDSPDLLRGKQVLVAGFSLRSGLGAVRLLGRLGCRVAAWDEKPEEALAEQKRLLGDFPLALFAGERSRDTGRVLDAAEGIVLSPGVPGRHPLLRAAESRGIPVISEVELAWLYRPGRWACVTGTDGKTTTTTLLGAFFSAAGFRTLTAGNIGLGLCGALLDAEEEGKPGPEIIVAELSSYQLETIRSLRPAAAIVLNITPDHLDRYDSLEDYAAAKARIWMNQTAGDLLIVNAEDGLISRMLSRFPPAARVDFFSRLRSLPEGLSLSCGRFVRRSGGRMTVLGTARSARLKGEHNWENILAAAGCAAALGVPVGVIREVLKSFRGLEHRNEECGRFRGRIFVNDSKATTVNAVRMALLSARGRVLLLMGGRAKGDDFSRLADLIRRKARLLVCYGEAGPVIREALGSVCSVGVPDLAAAVRTAWEASRPGDTILLSPGCASFDAFRDYEERGRNFKERVRLLAEENRR